MTYSPVSGRTRAEKLLRDPEACAKAKERQRKYYVANREKILLQQQKVKQRGSTCDILQNHAVELADDPERLSTEFLKKLIRVEYD